ncbi:Adenosine deaminase-related growth factor-like protein [Operophtera brumata]|uniref:Adenosine deaminase-related growth factor-like protein n=1 Tax=Operophtera brumata TaxID=104452 RepID=A0A0L7KWN2_OPEBR|nr:Adenosine deaminase-related growth factor-like protein [Operophtera brumata]
MEQIRSDENLLDALVLNSKRIGHAFALVKHPLLLEEVKKRKIAIEVNVISNTVLKLVDDLRNHPLAVFLASNVPIVLSSDDPGVWEAD